MQYLGSTPLDGSNGGHRKLPTAPVQTFLFSDIDRVEMNAKGVGEVEVPLFLTPVV